MSDRARSSVRTEPRAGAGAPDEVPSGAIPVTGSQPAADGQRKGSSAVGTGGGTQSPKSPIAQPPSGQIAVAPAASEKAPAGQAPEVSATQALDAKPAEPPAGQAPAKAAPAAQAPVGKAAQAPAAQASAAQAPAAQAPAAQAPGSQAPAGQAPAKAAQAPAGKAQAPAGKAAQAPAKTGQAPAKTGQAPAATATNAPAAGGVGAARSGVPAAGSVPVEATQAVTLPPAAAASASGQSRAVDAPASRTTGAPAGAGKSKGASRGPRRARLQLRHIDTWSALKISLVLSIALFFVWMVAVGILYGVLSGLGVFDSVNDLFGQLRSASGEEGAGGKLVSASVVFGGAAVIGAVNIVLLTALCTVTAFVYNLCSDLVGGLEVTLAERD